MAIHELKPQIKYFQVIGSPKDALSKEFVLHKRTLLGREPSVNH
jgi:hypothetical protein